MSLQAGRKGILASFVDVNGRLKASKIIALIPNATATVKGLIKAGTGLQASSGTLSVKVPVPEYATSDASKVLAVNADGTGLEWKTLE